MFKKYRLGCGLSESKAANNLFISRGTLVKFEVTNQVPADTVCLMAEVYENKALPLEYCRDHCMIGKKYHAKYREGNLESLVLNLSKGFNDVERVKNLLIDIAADGKISNNEKSDLISILNNLDKLHESIEGIKVWAINEGHLKV